VLNLLSRLKSKQDANKQGVYRVMYVSISITERDINVKTQGIPICTQIREREREREKVSRLEGQMVHEYCNITRPFCKRVTMITKLRDSNLLYPLSSLQGIQYFNKITLESFPWLKIA